MFRGSNNSEPTQNWQPNKRWTNVPQLQKDLMKSNLQTVSEKKPPLFQIEGSQLKLRLSIAHTLEFNALNSEQKVK